MILRKLLAPVLLSLVCATAHATPVHFKIDYQVQYIHSAIDPRVVIGDVYEGFFSIDSSLLMLGGYNLPGNVLAFTTTFEDVTWTLGQPYPLSGFAGFRGPTGRNQSSPGFDVTNGEITNLQGGVYGGGDYPFIDFSFDANNYQGPAPPCNGGQYCGNRTNAFWSINPLGAFGGSMTVSRIPEPETYALFALGIGFAAFMCRRSKQPSRARTAGC